MILSTWQADEEMRMAWLNRMLATKERVRSDVDLLNEEARKSAREKRLEGRTPYLKVAQLKFENGAHLHTVFTRDVSVEGLGLLHRMPIEPQNVELILELNSGTIIQIRLFLNWCISLGEGWFISGGDFLTDENFDDATSE